MKRLSKSWIFKACNFCIAFAGILHWTKMSLLLFGEQPYPTENEKSFLPFILVREQLLCSLTFLYCEIKHNPGILILLTIYS